MPILVDDLSVWDISFRWAGYDPRKFYFRVPLEVENNFRNLMDSILRGQISSRYISLEKRTYEPDEKMFSIYYWLDDIEACIHGHKNNRKLLRWAHIERYDFKLWCERMNIPLPVFWFPTGWNLEYVLPENDYLPGYFFHRKDWTPEHWEAWRKEQEVSDQNATDASPEAIASTKIRPNQEARIACQQIAKAIWKKEPDRTIASIVRDDLIQTYGGANRWTEPQIREWIKVVAPQQVRDRRGAPRKNTVKGIID